MLLLEYPKEEEDETVTLEGAVDEDDSGGMGCMAAAPIAGADVIATARLCCVSLPLSACSTCLWLYGGCCAWYCAALAVAVWSGT